ncbi:MAG TPA: diguanylate cyclase [Burkholderiaceae bacterium]|nr:diguanylate cyclase [Burkholderiaceae bacterium]
MPAALLGARRRMLAFGAAVALLPATAPKAAAPDALSAEERAWVRSHGEVVVAAPESSAPLAYVDSGGLAHGLSIEYLDLVAEATGIHFTLARPAPAAENLRRSRDHEVDILATSTDAEETQAYLATTSPYYAVPAVLVVRRDSALPDGIATLHGRIAVGSGDPAGTYLAQHFPALTVIPAADDQAALREVAAGRADGAVANRATASEALRDAALRDLRVASQVGYTYEFRFAYRRDWPVLGRILEKGLARIPQEQRVAVAERWVRGAGMALPGRAFGYVAGGVGVLASMIALVLLSLYHGFNRLVSLRTRELQAELVERQRIQDELRRLADCDGLTGLPNRIAFDREFERALALARRNNGLLAVLFIDLDAFKIINDTHGHDTGDRVLQAVAVRLLASVRASDLVSRRGGDEFVVALVDVGTESAALAVAHKILAEVASAAADAVPDFDLGCSIGISFFPSAANSAEELIRRADSAMYHGKSRGKNRVWLFRDGSEGIPGEYTAGGEAIGKARPAPDVEASEPAARRALAPAPLEPTPARSAPVQ